MKEVRIFKCDVCGSIVSVIKGDTNSLICCGEEMDELFPKRIDVGSEKHVPMVIEDKCHVTIQVGENEHPMEQKHYIEWIMILTNYGFKITYLKPYSKPIAKFVLLPDEHIIKVYEYCNIHGLWVKNIELK